jgi:methylmalonyl-CoA/ethylmalonyl-CoA epimerase
MLRILAMLALLTASSSWARAEATEGEASEALLSSRTALHVGIVVEDIDVAITHWTALLELSEKPSVIMAEGHESKPTHFKGHPTNARAKLAFFQLENIQIELIEPIGDEASDWHEFLTTKGAGVHHLAFKVRGLSSTETPKLKSAGYDLKQVGGWDGGEYLYLDSAAKLGVTLELLESFATAGEKDS